MFCKFALYLPLLFITQAHSLPEISPVPFSSSFISGEKTLQSINNCKIVSDKESSTHPQYYECSHECFSGLSTNHHSQCTVADVGCAKQDKFDRFNFFSLLYCNLQGNLYIFLPLAVLIIYFIFQFISATVDEYIAEGITYISDTLKLSEAMAAVTLIALANGAGDVITAIVASGSEGGVSYNIGALYGAGFFVCSAVIAMTILNAPKDKPIIVDKSTIYRDIGFYIISSVVILIFAFMGKIYWYSALIMLSIYILMVLVVYIQEKVQIKPQAEQQQQQGEEDSLQQSKVSLLGKLRKGVNKVIMANKVKNSFRSRSVKRKTLNMIKKQSVILGQQKSTKAETLQEGNEIENKLLPSKSINEDKDLEGQELNEHKSIDLQEKAQEEQGQIPSVQPDDDERENKSDEELSFSEKSMNEKIGFLIELPFEWIRKLTMPPCKEDSYEKELCILWPIPGMIFILWAINMLQVDLILTGALFLGLVLSLIFYYTQKNLKRGQIPKYFFIIAIISTVLGLLWTYVLSQMLIDLLNVFVVIFKLSNTFMGLTVLGVGNALPDALTTVALASKGYAQMGITGSYAGQLFGLLVGFGVAQLKQTLMEGPQNFDLFQNIQSNLLDILVIGICILALVYTAVYALKNKFEYGKGLAYVLMGMYGTFFVSAVGIQTWYLIDDIKA